MSHRCTDGFLMTIEALQAHVIAENDAHALHHVNTPLNETENDNFTFQLSGSDRRWLKSIFVGY
jgi:hypothetical protein